MSRTKESRNKRIALEYYAEAMSLRKIAKKYEKDPSTIQRIVVRYRKTMSPAQLQSAEKVRKFLITRKKASKTPKK